MSWDAPVSSVPLENRCVLALRCVEEEHDIKLKIKFLTVAHLTCPLAEPASSQNSLAEQISRLQNEISLAPETSEFWDNIKRRNATIFNLQADQDLNKFGVIKASERTAAALDIAENLSARAMNTLPGLHDAAINKTASMALYYLPEAPQKEHFDLGLRIYSVALDTKLKRRTLESMKAGTGFLPDEEDMLNSLIEKAKADLPPLEPH